MHLIDSRSLQQPFAKCILFIGNLRYNFFGTLKIVIDEDPLSLNESKNMTQLMYHKICTVMSLCSFLLSCSNLKALFNTMCF